ncbi:hypothetical protein FB567DRAFT_611506 [Paraphoma chrysanthemicola]|uniref:Actin-like ATPase domain-containing protein n=1 Tax=Paraphoma chrysanthemicola TaxID=798071 RepID=A0A8K0QWS2_9PLEO|nr:hypothetical protein FB567DRAFT_611506 [Paraphoma chrysanthemicola]
MHKAPGYSPVHELPTQGSTIYDSFKRYLPPGAFEEEAVSPHSTDSATPTGVPSTSATTSRTHSWVKSSVKGNTNNRKKSVGYATPQSNAKQYDLTEVRVVSNWGANMTNDVKIPSVISYSPSSEDHEQQFGASLSPKSVAMINTKLELGVQDKRLDELNLIIQALNGMKDLNFEHIRSAKGYPDYPWKKPEAIVTDYLTKAFKAFSDTTNYMTEIKRTSPVDIVITIPVGWSYRARNSTLKAIRNAGFNERNFPQLGRYIMVSEPKAAAIYTARYMQEQAATSLKKNECFILCDAGGGTVDAVGFKVKQISPSLELEQMTIPTGAKCGSGFINKDFKKWLRRILKAEYAELDPITEDDDLSAHATESGAMRELMKAFDAHKKAFHQDSTDMHIDLPRPLHKSNIPGNVEQGDLIITKKSMRSFFDPHVDEVIDLIQGQLTQFEDDRSCRVGAILLIGGFSESKYLQEELTKSMGLRDIRLHRPETSWSAVVRGAVLYGMENASRESVPEIIPCPRNYGVKTSASFSRRLHDMRDIYTDPMTNEVMVGEQLAWLIRKGDLMQVDDCRVVEQELVGSFDQEGTRSFSVPIYEYLDDDVPDRFRLAKDDVKQVAVLTGHFEGSPLERFDREVNAKGHVYYTAKFVCRLTVRGMDLLGELWWYGERLDHFKIENIHELSAI